MRLFLLGSLLLSGACIQALLVPPEGVEQPFCDVETPCSDGAKQCIFNRCFDPQQPFERVAINMHRDQRNQQFLDVDLSNSARLDLNLSAERLVSIAIVGPEGSQLAGRLVASREESIPGEPVQRVVQIPDSGEAVITLTEFAAWRLRFHPDATELPPTLAQRVTAVWTATDASIRIDLAAEHPEVTGRLVDGAGEAVAGRSLRLLDAEGRRISGRSETAADGRFVLKLQPGAEAGRLLVSGELLTEPAQLLPRRPTVDGDWGDLQLPNQGVAVPTAVVVRSADSETPIATDLVFRPVSAAGLVRYRVSTEDGVPTLINLAQGDWWVDVHPRGRDDLAATIGQSVEVKHREHQEMTLTLAKRVKVSGQVLLPDGQAAAGARLVFQQFLGPTREEDMAAWAQEEWVVEHQTGEDGRFELSLPPGDTALFVVPSAPHPRLLRLLALRDDLSLELEVGQGTLFSGQVSGDDGGGNTLIQVFSKELRFGDEAVLLGEGIATADGSFSIPLPAGN